MVSFHSMDSNDSRSTTTLVKSKMSQNTLNGLLFVHGIHGPQRMNPKGYGALLNVLNSKYCILIL